MFEHIGTYRSILALPPSKAAFQSLCEELLAHPPQEEVVEYLAQKLERWPIEVARSAPWQWIEMVKQGHHCPEMQLCTVIKANDRSFDSFEAFERLIRSPHVTQVRGLDLSDNPLDARWAASLGTSEALSGLTHLAMNSCGLDDDGLEHVLSSRVMRLRSLEVCVNDFDTRAGWHVASERSCQRLERLVWRNVRCRRESFWSLCVSPGLGQLHTLDLRGSSLCDVALVEGLAQARSLSSLSHLNLSYNMLSAPILGKVAEQLGAMTRLRSLDVHDHSELGADFIMRLVADAPRLEQLSLFRTVVDDACADVIVATPEFAGMKFLDVRSTKLTRAGAARLHEAFDAQRCEVLCDSALMK